MTKSTELLYFTWGKKETDYLDQLNEGSTGLHVIEQNNERTKKKKS